MRCGSQRDPAQGQRVFRLGGAGPSVQAMTAFTDAHREVRGRTDLQGEADPPSTSRMCRANPPDLRPQGARHDEVPCTRIRRVSDENEQAYSMHKVWPVPWPACGGVSRRQPWCGRCGIAAAMGRVAWHRAGPRVSATVKRNLRVSSFSPAGCPKDEFVQRGILQRAGPLQRRRMKNPRGPRPRGENRSPKRASGSPRAGRPMDAIRDARS